MSTKTKHHPSLMWAILLTVMEDELYAAGKDRTAIKGLTKGSLSKIVDGKTVAPRAGIDSLVDAYAQAIGCDPMTLWEKALTRWRDVRPQAAAWLKEWHELHDHEVRVRAGEVARAKKPTPKRKTKAAKKATRRTA